MRKLKCMDRVEVEGVDRREREDKRDVFLLLLLLLNMSVMRSTKEAFLQDAGFFDFKFVSMVESGNVVLNACIRHTCCLRQTRDGRACCAIAAMCSILYDLWVAFASHGACS